MSPTFWLESRSAIRAPLRSIDLGRKTPANLDMQTANRRIGPTMIHVCCANVRYECLKLRKGLV